MIRFSTYFLSRVLLFILINVCAVQVVLAQAELRPSLGVSFPVNVSDQDIIETTTELKAYGIQVIELHHPVSDDLIEELSDNAFQILVRNEIQFLTQSELDNPEVFDESFQPFLNRYIRNTSINSLGLTSYSTELGSDLLGLIVNQKTDSSVISFYEINSYDKESLTITDARNFPKDQKGAYFFFEAPFQSRDIQLISRVNEFGSRLILFDYYWLMQALESESYLREALIAFSDSEDTGLLLPISEPQTTFAIPDWPIVILVLLWISLGIHLRSNLTYRPLIFRYFTYHRFFVDDIMRYRERSSTPGIVLFIQHAYFTGLIIYVLSHTLFSEKGLEALYFHLPVLAIFGQNHFTLFAIAVLFTLLFSFISLLWLYIPSKSMNHFSQVLSLYSWVFHLDFLLVSISLIVLITSGSSLLIYLLCIAHFLFWILGFIVAAYDSSKYQMTGRFKYLFNTIGLFLIIIGTSIILFIFSGYPYDIIRLAASL